ncbi:DUF3298 and DUF4163 domain-containing protein [Sporolactobacillus spathodeae]|uniref:DUF3298/DUF4163 domain-containing protein n=1 Tax=Sporolactobacillus spathodeae TaxID=1465502 RepID=A0ABS2QBT3_9BACL|nr:DUF3298 and DUF4163 domain-containing protein [Sporolactobacillus spathodeae]MBM7658422.1 hypothetical protein [Sporolactobacillus spathodeae]
MQHAGNRLSKLAVSLLMVLSVFFTSTAALAQHPTEHSCTMPAKIKIVKLADHIFYPVITGGVEQPKIQGQINQTFLDHARKVQELDKKYKKQYERDRFISAAGPYYAQTQPTIRYNQRCRLSVSFVDESYTGGAHGMHLETVYNYNLHSGKRLSLSNIIKNKKERDKVNSYLKKQMTQLKQQGRYDFFLDSFKGVDVKNGQFYFYDEGIVIVFQEYEVAPYSNGIIHLKVPFREFKTPHAHHHHAGCHEPGSGGCGSSTVPQHSQPRE